MNTDSSKPKPYTQQNRWKIRGKLTTESPLHIGNGDATSHVKLINTVTAIERDHTGNPCIPGSAIKGVIRSWAERYYKQSGDSIRRIFGDSETGAGLAEFYPATWIPPDTDQLQQFEATLPYWQPEKCTGILSHVCIDRHYGTAEEGKLFSEEFVPERVSFDLEIFAERLSDEDIQLLLAILEHGSNCDADPIQFGANGADGWGRVSWELKDVSQSGPQDVTFDEQAMAFTRAWHPANLALLDPPRSDPRFVTMSIELQCHGAFLVNDTSRTHRDEGDNLPNFFPLRRADGGAWLPASSFRGALRQRAEFILRSLNPNATGDPNGIVGDGPIERLFGVTGYAARLKLKEPMEIQQKRPNNQFGYAETYLQDFVAIDRFTGGAANEAKFEAITVWKPIFKICLVVDTPEEETKQSDLALLLKVVHDLCSGLVPLGWGGAKGLGDVKGKAQLLNDGCSFPDQSVILKIESGVALPRWITDSLKTFRTADAEAEIKVSNRVMGNLSCKQVRVPRRNQLPLIGWKYSLTCSVLGQGNPLEVDESLVPESLRQQGTQDKPVQVFVRLNNGKCEEIRIPANATPETATLTPPVVARAPRRSTGNSFAHPYYFLPQVDRNNMPEQLDDTSPASHLRYFPGRFSGKLTVGIEVETPLLLCGRELSDSEGHKTYGINTRDDLPFLAPSSIRGMLRSAYEALTNSRFGVFPSKPTALLSKRANARRLGFRMTAEDGLGLVPVRIENGQALLMLGTSPSLPSWKHDRWHVDGAQYAAWVPLYQKDSKDKPDNAVVLSGATPCHGQKASCILEKIQHKAIPFQFWRVRFAAESENALPSGPCEPTRETARYRSLNVFIKKSGYFVITNQNSKNKHDERFFFEDSAGSHAAVLSSEVFKSYMELIADCQELHNGELQDRIESNTSPGHYTPSVQANENNPAQPEIAALSRHSYEPTEAAHSGTRFCYASVKNINGQFVIQALYPVMISRSLYARTASELASNKELSPASSIDELSPADRVFGWVKQKEEGSDEKKKSAYRSSVRVGAVICLSESETSKTLFEVPKKLAILGQPKPQQGRFYLGKSDGHAQPIGLSKDASGYHDGNSIRGPKTYPVHIRAETYGTGEQDALKRADQWQTDNPHAFSSQESSQNRSVTGWVNPGTKFEFELNIENLSKTELGALVWLLTLPESHCLRLGLGKPLGFGSVRVELKMDTVKVTDGGEMIRQMTEVNYKSNNVEVNEVKQEFESIITSANAEILESFLIATKGFDSPIHYPLRIGQTLDDAKQFEWFVVNENQDNRTVLPALTDPDPYLRKN